MPYQPDRGFQNCRVVLGLHGHLVCHLLSAKIPPDPAVTPHCGGLQKLKTSGKEKVHSDTVMCSRINGTLTMHHALPQGTRETQT